MNQKGKKGDTVSTRFTKEAYVENFKEMGSFNIVNLYKKNNTFYASKRDQKSKGFCRRINFRYREILDKSLETRSTMMTT